MVAAGLGVSFPDALHVSLKGRSLLVCEPVLGSCEADMVHGATFPHVPFRFG